MKLSEAIRLGAMLRPQIKGRTRSYLGTCAFGAAEDAVGKPLIDIHEWDNLLVQHPPCPVCGSGANTANVISEHLNDGHGWTRERIADWVKTIEPHEEPNDVEAHTTTESQCETLTARRVV